MFSLIFTLYVFKLNFIEINEIIRFIYLFLFSLIFFLFLLFTGAVAIWSNILFFIICLNIDKTIYVLYVFYIYVLCLLNIQMNSRIYIIERKKERERE